jgi:hypothetical protein
MGPKPHLNASAAKPAEQEQTSVRHRQPMITLSNRGRFFVGENPMIGRLAL